MNRTHEHQKDPAGHGRVPSDMKQKNLLNISIPFGIRCRCTIQKWVDWIFFPLLAPVIIFILKYVQKNRIKDLKKIRMLFKRIAGESKIPTLICANHLTKVDSIYIHHAFASLPFYWRHFRLFSWNIPAKENFWTKPLDRLVTYLGKCIPIVRTGTPEHHKEVLDTLRYLLARGELCTVFPEGGRSPDGRVNVQNVRYGVGTILNGLPDYRVLCVYMRAENQKEMSDLPPKGDTLYFDFKVITPQSIQTGRRAERDISRTIIEKIKEMEDLYFEKYKS
ncbi:lysophospholipid acyltransferase family protein [Fidelibacter multiformis]|uniref:lysophospholipid acyltransferase family protein n=1 Tax=Fidelibacter multiformis TaxID=3377529 RepID=UPI0037DD3083